MKKISILVLLTSSFAYGQTFNLVEAKSNCMLDFTDYGTIVVADANVNVVASEGSSIERTFCGVSVPVKAVPGKRIRVPGVVVFAYAESNGGVSELGGESFRAGTRQNRVTKKLSKGAKDIFINAPKVEFGCGQGGNYRLNLDFLVKGKAKMSKVDIVFPSEVELVDCE